MLIWSCQHMIPTCSSFSKSGKLCNGQFKCWYNSDLHVWTRVFLQQKKKLLVQCNLVPKEKYPDGNVFFQSYQICNIITVLQTGLRLFSLTSLGKAYRIWFCVITAINRTSGLPFSQEQNTPPSSCYLLHLAWGSFSLHCFSQKKRKCKSATKPHKHSGFFPPVFYIENTASLTSPFWNCR